MLPVAPLGQPALRPGQPRARPLPRSQDVLCSLVLRAGTWDPRVLGCWGDARTKQYLFLGPSVKCSRFPLFTVTEINVRWTAGAGQRGTAQPGQAWAGRGATLPGHGSAMRRPGARGPTGRRRAQAWGDTARPGRVVQAWGLGGGRALHPPSLGQAPELSGRGSRGVHFDMTPGHCLASGQGLEEQ